MVLFIYLPERGQSQLCLRATAASKIFTLWLQGKSYSFALFGTVCILLTQVHHPKELNYTAMCKFPRVLQVDFTNSTVSEFPAIGFQQNRKTSQQSRCNRIPPKSHLPSFFSIPVTIRQRARPETSTVELHQLIATPTAIALFLTDRSHEPAALVRCQFCSANNLFSTPERPTDSDELINLLRNPRSARKRAKISLGKSRRDRKQVAAGDDDDDDDSCITSKAVFRVLARALLAAY